MSMQGIGPGGPQWLRTPETTKPAQEPEVREQAPAQTPARATRPEVQSPVAPPKAEAGPGTSAAPEGVDPELWSLLTTEERAHFSRFAAMGGVTYGPHSKGASSPPVRGHRLDLRI